MHQIPPKTKEERWEVTIKEEFRKAYTEYRDASGAFWTGDGVALWAAKWMAERCAKDIVSTDPVKGWVREKCAEEIRQLAKELT